MFSQQCILTSAVPAREVSVVSKLISKGNDSLYDHIF